MQPIDAQTRTHRYARALLFCCAPLTLSSICTLSSSITHAETGADLSTKLDKLGYAQGEAIERLENYRVNGWNYVDDQHIVIYSGASKRYLISTLIDCRELSSAENIGFTSTSNTLTKFDKLIVSGVGGIVKHCPITEIKTLTKIEKQS